MAYLTVQKIAADLKRKGSLPPPADARVSYERLGVHFLDELTARGYEVAADRQNNTIALTLGDERMLLGRGSLRNKGSILPLTGVKRGAPAVTVEDFWKEISADFKIDDFAKLPISLKPAGAPVVDAVVTAEKTPTPAVKVVVPAEKPAAPVVKSAAAVPAEKSPAVTVIPTAPAVKAAPAAPAAVKPSVPPISDSGLPDEPFPTITSADAASMDDGLAPMSGSTAAASAKPAAATPKPGVHSTTGILVEHGVAPYQNKPENTRSYFLTVKTKDGDRTLWGADLERAIKEGGLKKGDTVEATNLGSRDVEISVPRPGGPAEKVVAKRNVWSVELRSLAAPGPVAAPRAPVAAAPAGPAAPPAVPATSPSGLPVPALIASATASTIASDEAEYVKENVRAVLSLSCFADAKFDALRKDSLLEPSKWARHSSVRKGQLTSPNVEGITLSETTLLALNILMWPPDGQRSAAAALTRGSKDPLVGDSPATTVDNAVRHLLMVPPSAATAVALLFLADKPASFKQLLERQRTLSGVPAPHSEYLEKLTLGSLNFTAPKAIEALNDVQPDARQWEALKRRPDVAAYSGMNTPESKPHVERLLSLAVLAKALPKTAVLADVQGAMLPTLAGPAAEDTWEPLRTTLNDRMEKDLETIRAAEAGMARIAATAKAVPLAYGKSAAAFTEAASALPLMTRFTNLFRRPREVSTESAPGYTTLRITDAQFAKIKHLLDGKVDYKPAAAAAHTDVNLGSLAKHVPEAIEKREAVVKSVEDRLNQRQRLELTPSVGMSI